MKRLFLALVLCLVSTVIFAQNEETVQSSDQTEAPKVTQLDLENYVTKDDFKMSIAQMNNQYEQQLKAAGYCLEQAGRCHGAAMGIALGGGLIGAVLEYASTGGDFEPGVGVAIVAASAIAAMVFECCSASYLKKSGVVLSSHGITYRIR